MGQGHPRILDLQNHECFTHGRSATEDGNAKEGVPRVHHSSRGRYSSALWLLCVQARALELGKGQAVCSYTDSKAKGGSGHSPQRLPRGRCRNNRADTAAEQAGQGSRTSVCSHLHPRTKGAGFQMVIS